MVYIAKPVNIMTSSNIFARNPTYESDLYYQNELDYTFDNSQRNYTFQVKIEQTDQYDMWTTVHRYPRSFAFCMVQIGGYIGFFSMFVICLSFMNASSLNKELYRHHAEVQNYDIEHVRTPKDDPTHVFSIEEFIEMKEFIKKIKKVPEVQNYLDQEERSSLYNSHLLDKGEQRLLRKSTMAKKKVGY